jgi:phage baseplate assembly protein W
MRVGVDGRTGQVLTGWAHCAQCLGNILSTLIGQTGMLRQYGSPALDLQDRNGTPLNIMRIYVGVAAAIRSWEPGFRLRTVQIVRAGPDGVFALLLSGIFYPNGHLGDYSISEERDGLFAANDIGFRVLGIAT